MGQEECELCTKRVYLMERLAVGGHVFHRTCFKCHSCSVQLKPGTYEYDNKSDKFYCRSHYRDLIRQRTIKRTIEERNLTSPTHKGEREDEEGEGGVHSVKRKKVPDAQTSNVNSVTVDDVQPASDTRDSSEVNKDQTTPTSVSLATPTDISRQESAHIRSGLPSLLKTLAAAKHEENTSPPLSPDQSVMGQETSIRDSVSGTVPNTDTTTNDSNVTITTEKTLSTPVANGNGDNISNTVSPEKLSSGQQLPGKLLSGKQIATKLVMSDRVSSQEVCIEKEKMEGNGSKVKVTNGGVEEEETIAPVKPPRRRTKKITTPTSSTPSPPLPEHQQEKVWRDRGHLAIFDCYLMLLLALVVYCGFYSLYWCWTNL